MSKPNPPFWDTSVMNVGVKLALQHLGSQGRYKQFSPAKRSGWIGAGLYTENAGKFWYGDIDPDNDVDALQKIACGMSETLYIIPSGLGGTDDRPLVEQSIFSVKPN